MDVGCAITIGDCQTLQALGILVCASHNHSHWYTIQRHSLVLVACLLHHIALLHVKHVIPKIVSNQKQVGFSLTSSHPLTIVSILLCLPAPSRPPTERLEEDLFSITSTLGNTLASVSQLEVTLCGTEPEDNFTACEPSTHPPFGTHPASVLTALARLSSPITHISVLGQVETPSDFSILPLLAAAQASCAASVTHITVNVPRMMDRLEDEDDIGSEDLLPSFATLNDDSCSMLQSLVCLSHLHLDGFVESAAVWGALPATLTSLKLAFVMFGPEQGVVLPALQRLALGQCGCSELALVLKAAPMLSQLDLGEVCSPGTTQVAADLTAIYDHPLMRLDCSTRSGGGVRGGGPCSHHKVRTLLQRRDLRP